MTICFHFITIGIDGDPKSSGIHSSRLPGDLCQLKLFVLVDPDSDPKYYGRESFGKELNQLESLFFGKLNKGDLGEMISTLEDLSRKYPGAFTDLAYWDLSRFQFSENA
jgi:hypothetical protein